MDDFLVKALQRLNENIERLADFFTPTTYPPGFSKFRAFRAFSQNNRLIIRGIACHDPVRFRELKGIDHAVAPLRTNTEQFICGLPCNNVLLYGPRGTGKSSAVKALLNTYARRGLRMIEIHRDSLLHIPEVADFIRTRQERFIAFCDDLSFEDDNKSYIQLKAILEGGLEAKPENMLIYATSNRRHLMPEMTEDNLPRYSAAELHPSETLEEKISLSDRFGLRLGLANFDMETYLAIIFNYARLRKLNLAKDDLHKRAFQWSIEHGNFSGRTARQFIDNLEGQLGLENQQK